MINNTAPPLIEIENLSLGVKRVNQSNLAIIRSVSLQLQKGETLGIVGESGSGKSTLALSMMGYLDEGLSLFEGRVVFDKRSLFDLSMRDLTSLRGGVISLVPQNAGQSLTPTMTILEQINETLSLHSNLTKPNRPEKSIELLNQVRLPNADEIAQRYPHELSGGQQQRCAIAMALAAEPMILLLDEPTTGLDVTTQSHILDLLSDLSKEKEIAMVFVSHDLGCIARISDRIAVMYAGEVIEIGSSKEVLKQPAHPYTRALIESIPKLNNIQIPDALDGHPPTIGTVENQCGFAARCRHVQTQCTTEPPKLISEESGRQIRCHFDSSELEIESGTGQVRQSIEHPESLLISSKTGITYDKPPSITWPWQQADQAVNLTVDNISFTLNQGETLGIVGESGSGKSTILKAISGLNQPCKGHFTFLDDLPLKGLAQERSLQCQKDIQMIFQNPDASLNPRKTIGEIIIAPMLLYFDMTTEQTQLRATELLEKVRLNASYLNRFPGQLSGGEKQRIGIARAFAAEPKLALCDEVTSALDVSVQAAVLALLNELQNEQSVGYLFVSHDLPSVRMASDKLLVLYQGRICETGRTESVFLKPYHPYTEALLKATLEPDPDIKPELLIQDTPEKGPPTSGCPFQRRCQRKLKDICDTVEPPDQTIDGHTIKCHIDRDELSSLQDDDRWHLTQSLQSTHTIR